MAFINEFIPPDDVVEYGIEEIDHKYGKFIYNPHWTIDRERDIYFREVATGREEFATQSTWTFYWKGSLIRVITDMHIGDDSNGEPFVNYILVTFELPTDLLENRDEILSGLKDALTARNCDGVHTIRPVSKSTFNF